jgi:uncharacterized protein (TIGR02646 family)
MDKKDDISAIQSILKPKNNHIWGELKDDLENLSFGKCWYSEAKEIASHYHVDHFRPKLRCRDITGKVDGAGYWWLAYDWKNYRLSGSAVNTSKNDNFAVSAHRAADPAHPEKIDDEIVYLLDPLRQEDVALIVFNENGEAMPINPRETEWEYKRARYTIDTLNLNHRTLVRARKSKWHEMAKLIQQITQIQKSAHVPLNIHPMVNSAAPSALGELTAKIREYISPVSELSGTYRACLRASQEDWGVTILQEPIDLADLQSRYKRGELS